MAKEEPGGSKIIYLKGGVPMRIWQMRQARVKLSEVIRCASLGGPQILTRRGVEVAVVLSYPEYLQLKGKQVSLSEFFRRSPLGEIDLERDRSAAGGSERRLAST